MNVCLCYIYVPCMCSAQGGQKMMSDSLELELRLAVKCHMGAKKQSWVLPKSI